MKTQRKQGKKKILCENNCRKKNKKTKHKKIQGR